MILRWNSRRRGRGRKHFAPRWSGRIAMTCRCCRTENPSQFGSEGQKRTLAIALKMAQAEFLTGIHGSPPVLLIDDVMGELDVKRRSGLLPLLTRSREASGQVFMTCTDENWPSELGKDLHRWTVRSGTVQRI